MVRRPARNASNSDEDNSQPYGRERGPSRGGERQPSDRIGNGGGYRGKGPGRGESSGGRSSPGRYADLDVIAPEREGSPDEAAAVEQGVDTGVLPSSPNREELMQNLISYANDNAGYNWSW